MNATQAKELLSPIAKENFIKDEFTNGIGKCCAVGHLVRLTSDNPSDYSKENCSDLDFSGSLIGRIREGAEDVHDFVRTKVNKFLKEERDQDTNLAGVNNYSFFKGYHQDNPKDRVISLLDDMIKAGY